MPANREDPTTRFAANPDDRVAFELLEEQLFMQADWPALADAYRARKGAASLAELPRERAALALRLGQLLEERLSDADGAIAAYTEVVRLDSSQRLALRHLRRLYTARHSWAAVLQVCEQQVALAESGAERARIYAEMGDIWKRELGDPAHAATHYELARSESGGATPADADADEIELETDADDSAVQAAWLAAARGDTDAAIAGLERVLASEPTHVEALDMLLSVLDGAQRTGEMAPLLERRIALATDPETRAAVLVRLGALREELGDVGEAGEAYERALDANPAHAGARAALRRTYRQSEAWSALRRLLEQGLEDAGPKARVDLLCELGALFESHLDDLESARERFAQAQAIDPDDRRVAAALARLGEEPSTLTMPDLDLEPEPVGAEQRSTRIVGVLERKLEHLEARGEERGAEALRIRLRLAELRGGALGEPAVAVELLEPLLADCDALHEAAPMLAGFYEQLGRMEPLMGLAERAADLCEPLDERSFWRRRAAEAARAHGDPERAIAAYRTLLAESPGDRGARSALCELYRSHGEIEPLIELLLAELPRADAEREFDLQLELASLRSDAQRDERGALVHLRRCLELQPDRRDLLDWALETCERHGGGLAQLDLLEHLVRRSQGATTRATLLARRGALLAGSLEWHDEAAESWRAALALDPEQSEARERFAAVADAAGVQAAGAYDTIQRLS